jgi:RNA polymerase sigma-70 factor (ECF subfamily)
VNVATNMLRKNKIKKIFVKEPVEEFDDLLPDILSPDSVLEADELEKKFLATLTQLPEKQRETFALRYFEELSYDEISKMLGTSVGGLKANYFQAVQKLSKLLL